MKKIIFVIAISLLVVGCCEKEYIYINGKRPMLPELENNTTEFVLDYEIVEE